MFFIGMTVSSASWRTRAFQKTTLAGLSDSQPQPNASLIWLAKSARSSFAPFDSLVFIAELPRRGPPGSLFTISIF
jgi:hypothetical protein